MIASSQSENKHSRKKINKKIEKMNKNAKQVESLKQKAKQDLLVEQMLQQPTSRARQALAKAITLAESPRAKDQQRTSLIIKQLRKAHSPYSPHSPRSLGHSLSATPSSPPPLCRRIAIAGAPGAGKSSLIAALCAQLLKKSEAKAEQAKIAVVAVDPSAVGGGGAILADKTRMHAISNNERIFVRPSPAVKGEALARGLLESIMIYENCGFNHIIIESVGSGQAETAIADYVDCIILLVSTKSGDALQGMKRGILELADFLIVSKADGAEREKARKTLGEYQQAAQCFLEKEKNTLGKYRICSVQRENDIEELCNAINGFFLKKTRLEIVQNRAKQKQNLFLRAWSECALEYAIEQLLEQTLEKKTSKAGGKEGGKAVGKGSAAQRELNERLAGILKRLAAGELEESHALARDAPLPAESARAFFWGGGDE